MSEKKQELYYKACDAIRNGDRKKLDDAMREYDLVDKPYEKYSSTVKADGKIEHLPTFARSKEEAEREIKRAYDGYVKNGYVKEYLIISVWKTDDFSAKKV